MNIDNLRKQWHSIDVPESDIREIERMALAGRSVVPMRDRLMRIGRYQLALCVVGVLCMLPAVTDHTLMVVLVDLFFIAMGIVHMMQLRTLRRLDPSRVTVTEALGLVWRYETVRSRKRLIGITVVVPIVVYIVLTLSSSYGAVIIPSCIVGALCGCLVAILINRRTTRLLHALKRELGDGHIE